MKKSNMIEIMLYIVLIVFGVIALFYFQPNEIEFEIPRQFEINKVNGGHGNGTLFD